MGFTGVEWEAEQSEGQFYMELDNESYVLTYSLSGFTGWKYISITSMKELMSESRSIGWFTFYVVLTMIILSSLIVWLFSKRLYLPIEKLVNKINQRSNGKSGTKRSEVQVIEEHLHDLFSSKSLLLRAVVPIKKSF